MGNVCCGTKEEGTKSAAFQQSATNKIGGDSVDDNTVRTSDDQQVLLSSSDPLYSNSPYNNDGSLDPYQQQQLQLQQQQFANQINNNVVDDVTSKKEKERYEALRYEQARLEQIVQMTGRAMVSIRSTRGNTGYYDQGFAAALWQHLQQTAAYPPDGTIDRFFVPTLRQLPTPAPITQQPVPDSSLNGKATEDNTDETPVIIAVDKGKDLSTVYGRLCQPMWDSIDIQALNTTTIIPPTPTISSDQQRRDTPIIILDHIAESYIESIVPKKNQLFIGSGPIVEALL